MIRVKELVAALERHAPLHFAESYDNPGLLCGDPESEIKGVVTCLDCTEAVVEEAIEMDCNVIVAHHPVIFKGIKSLTGRTYVERTLIKAIKNDVAIYAIHTNIDSILEGGVSQMLGHQLGVEKMQVLQARQEQKQVELTVLEMRVEDAQKVAIDCTDQAFSSMVEVETVEGPRQWMRWTGRSDRAMELIHRLKEQGMTAQLMNSEVLSPGVGLGVIGELPVPMPETVFLSKMKETLGGTTIRHTSLLGKSIHKVALCGGSGAFLLPQAKSAGADIFITGDFKYHEFFDAENNIIIADIGHYESEQWTISLLKEWISKKFSTFAVHCTTVVTNPVNYF
jgi:dinuclear metal center YbgI/SA1388 family protein